MNLEMLLLMASIPAAMVGLILFARKVPRWARDNGAEAPAGRATGLPD